jgi:hypothetical protein
MVQRVKLSMGCVVRLNSWQGHYDFSHCHYIQNGTKATQSLTSCLLSYVNQCFIYLIYVHSNCMLNFINITTINYVLL